MVAGATMGEDCFSGVDGPGALPPRREGKSVWEGDGCLEKVPLWGEKRTVVLEAVRSSLDYSSRVGDVMMEGSMRRAGKISASAIDTGSDGACGWIWGLGDMLGCRGATDDCGAN